MDELFSVPEAAAKLGHISRWTIYSWLSKWSLRKTRVGGRVMIAAKDLQEFLARCNSDKKAK
jgi:excisionase family DNA binding protein